MPMRALLACSLLALTAGAAHADYTLHVLHTNYLHCRLEPINGFDSTCSEKEAAEAKCFGGIARLASKVSELRSALAGQNVLLLDAGDQFQGSLIYTIYKGSVVAEAMNAVGYDAMALGNHEFDDGPQGLAPFLDLVKFPVMAGNVDVSRLAPLQNKLRDSIVLEVGGQKIGLVSVLTTDTAEIASPGADVLFREEIESVKADVADLEAQGVTKIIAVNHVGYLKDQELAAAVPGLDAVVGGHSHTYLSATDPERTGPYPTWVSAADGALVPVVQAYAYSKYLGHLELTFDDNGNLKYAGGNTLLLDASVPEDPALVARIAELQAPIADLRARVVGEAAAPIDGARDTCRAKECAMGNLVAEAMLDRVKGQGITLAIQNGGGVRASIDAGPVTMGEVLTVLPFQNTLATFQATGADVIAALENGVSKVEEGAGRFPQVAGLTYAFDPAAPAGQRISDVKVKEGDALVPIDPAKLYGLVTNNYVRGGGDGFRVFATNSVNAYDFGPDLADVLADYIGKVGVFTPGTDGRITVK